MLHHPNHNERRRLHKQVQSFVKFRKERFTTILCKCSHKLQMQRPAFLMHDVKGRAVCPRCNLSWHLDLKDKITSHIWKLNGKDVHYLKKKKPIGNIS